jgi:hypothetical protein
VTWLVHSYCKLPVVKHTPRPSDVLHVLHVMPCRRGYDVVAFAAAGAELSVGLDICPDAIAAANRQRDEQLAGHPDAAKVGASNPFECV